MAAKTKFRGSFTALVTPFKNGSVDEAAFRGLVNWQIAEGTHGLVPVGTTGESPTLSHDEHKRVVEWCIEEAKGRVPVIAGAGSNSTKEAIELAEHAEKAGANAVLVVTKKPDMLHTAATWIKRLDRNDTESIDQLAHINAQLATYTGLVETAVGVSGVFLGSRLGLVGVDVAHQHLLAGIRVQLVQDLLGADLADLGGRLAGGGIRWHVAHHFPVADHARDLVGHRAQHIFDAGVHLGDQGRLPGQSLHLPSA